MLPCNSRHLFETKNVHQIKIMADFGLLETLIFQDKDARVHNISGFIAVTYQGYFIYHGYFI